jgi:hypothetical protein
VRLIAGSCRETGATLGPETPGICLELPRCSRSTSE